jgi:hypothetical protein
MVLENTSSRLQMTSDLLIKSTYAGEPASRLKMARTCRAAGVTSKAELLVAIDNVSSLAPYRRAVTRCRCR